jgi:hypothetical protein
MLKVILKLLKLKGIRRKRKGKLWVKRNNRHNIIQKQGKKCILNNNNKKMKMKKGKTLKNIKIKRL